MIAGGRAFRRLLQTPSYFLGCSADARRSPAHSEPLRAAYGFYTERTGPHEDEELLTPHKLNAEESRRILYVSCQAVFTLEGCIGVSRLFI